MKPKSTGSSSGGMAVPDHGIDLAVLNTRLALDRTQLAWVRTGFGFITAGIAIDKAAEALHAARLLTHHEWVKGSHLTGLVMISSSTVILLLVTIGYLKAAGSLPHSHGVLQLFSAAVVGLTALLVLTGAMLTYLVLTTDF